MSPTGRVLVQIGCCSLLCVSLSCTDAGPALHDVKGIVTFDGEPVEDGQIIFHSTEEGGTPDAGPIKNGTFAFKSRAGSKKVDIQAMREIPGKTVPDPVEGTRPALENYIPERYNTKTELEADVNAGPNVFDFALTGEDPS